MHPNAFLAALWRTETLSQVFVAMSFEERFVDRFESIVRPAIEGELLHGERLKAYRVDNSKTGDSILTDIVNGIAHSRLIVADVSAIDEGRFTETPVRNGNVMYEVGVALACRSSSEVLLIRDDRKQFLFDVSTIPHLFIDFTDRDAAATLLREALTDRIRETVALRDARVAIAASTLTQDELRVLRAMADLRPDQARDISHKALGGLSIPNERGVAGLLRKDCLKSIGVNPDSGSVLYRTTPFGYTLALAVDDLLQNYVPEAESRGGSGEGTP